MKVAVYMPDYNERHCEVLQAFADGIPGAEVRPLSKFKPDTDIAVVFGWYKYAFEKTMAKKPIIEEYLGRGQLIVIESAFLKRKQYYQIGWNGFAGHADFKNEGVPMDRWKKLGIPVKPWQKRRDGLIVVCGQLPRDTQVQDVDHIKWCQETVAWYQKRFGARVVFRPHPRMESPSEYGIISYHDGRKLSEVLSEASLVVTWNSTTGVEAAVAGVPVVTCSPGSMASPVAMNMLAEHPVFPERKEWLAGLGYSQWTLEEMRQGLPWYHLTRTTNYTEAVVNV